MDVPKKQLHVVSGFQPPFFQAAKGYSKPKAMPAPVAEPVPEPAAVKSPPVASSPVASPVSAPPPGTVEVKEEAKPEDGKKALTDWQNKNRLVDCA